MAVVAMPIRRLGLEHLQSRCCNDQDADQGDRFVFHDVLLHVKVECCWAI